MGSVVQGASCWLWSPVYPPAGLLLPLNLPRAESIPCAPAARSRLAAKASRTTAGLSAGNCVSQSSPPATPLQNPRLRSRRQPYVLQVRKVAGNHPGKDIFRDILGVHRRFCEQPEQRDVGELGELMVADLPQ